MIPLSIEGHVHYLINVSIIIIIIIIIIIFIIIIIIIIIHFPLRMVS